MTFPILGANGAVGGLIALIIPLDLMMMIMPIYQKLYQHHPLIKK
jgi:hypothetical protein